MRVLVVTLLLLAGCADEGQAPEPEPVVDDIKLFETGGIEGLVLDETVRPVRDATVSLPGLQREAKTDKDGQFLITGLLPGAVYVEIDAVGFEAVGAEVTIPDQGNVKLHVTLVRMPSEDPWMETQKFQGHTTFAFAPVLSELGCTCTFQVAFGGNPDTVIVEAHRTTPPGDPTGALSQPHYFVDVRTADGTTLSEGMRAEPMLERYETPDAHRFVLDIQPGEYWPTPNTEFDVFATAFHNAPAPDGWSIKEAY